MTQSFSDLDTGWSWVAMVACFICNFVIGGANYSVGLIHSTLLAKFHDNQATTSIVGALHTAIMNLAGPLSSIIIDKYSTRTALVTSGILFTIGYLSSAFAPTLEVTIFTCGIVAGLGGSIGWTACMIGVGFYFRRYRNLAQGIAMAGAGVGVFGIAPIAQYFRDQFGSTGFFVALSCITLQLIIAGTALIPSQLEIHTHKKRALELKSRGQAKGFVSMYLNVFTTKAVMCIALSIFLFCLGSYVIFMYLPTFCESLGATPMQASYIISACGAASIFGRLLTGVLASFKKIDEVILLSGSMGLLGIATVLFPLYSHVYSGQMVYAIILGLFYGTPFVILTPINIAFLGVANMAAALGIELCLGGIGAIIGPISAGYILDAGATFEVVFIIAGSACILGAILGVLSIFVSKRLDTLSDNLGAANIVLEITASSEKDAMLHAKDAILRGKDSMLHEKDSMLHVDNKLENKEIS